QRQVDLCEFEASLVYKELVPGQVPKLQRNPVSKNKNNKQTNKQTNKLSLSIYIYILTTIFIN
ncbi:hypothetical protein LEMLEM_LOCUS6705, partial [Lemmus lemmus]